MPCICGLPCQVSRFDGMIVAELNDHYQGRWTMKLAGLDMAEQEILTTSVFGFFEAAGLTPCIVLDPSSKVGMPLRLVWILMVVWMFILVVGKNLSVSSGGTGKFSNITEQANLGKVDRESAALVDLTTIVTKISSYLGLLMINQKICCCI